MSLKKKFGKRVKTLREERKLSQAQFGEMVGIEALAVSKIENEENFIKEKKQKAIANALCVSYTELFNFEEEKENIENSKTKSVLCHLNGLNESGIDFILSVIKAYKNTK